MRSAIKYLFQNSVFFCTACINDKDCDGRLECNVISGKCESTGTWVWQMSNAVGDFRISNLFKKINCLKEII